MSCQQSKGSMRRWLLTAISLTLVIVAAVIFIWRRSDGRQQQIIALLETDRTIQALESANELLRESPQDDNLLRMKCHALERLGRWHEMVGAYSLMHSPTVADLRRWANGLMRLSQWQAAADALVKAQAAAPDDGELASELTACWLQLKRPVAAIDSAQRSLQIPGYRGRACLQLAAAYRQLDDLHNVSRHLEMALVETDEPLPLTPREICLSAAESLLVEGRARHALKVLHACPVAEADVQLPMLCGDALRQLGEYAAAEAEYRRVLGVDPLHRSALESLAETKLQQERPQEAVELLLPLAESSNPALSTAYFLQRGYTDLRNFSEARRWQERCDELRNAERVLRSF